MVEEQRSSDEHDRLDQVGIASALRTIELETAALGELGRSLRQPEQQHAFSAAVDLLLTCTGRIALTGMGKSGLIGRKIASTLCSTGTTAIFVHPAEASHGDLGMIKAGDVVVALSWSGETSELFDVIDHCRRLLIPLVSITSARQSTLALESRLTLLLPEVTEACPNHLAPTSSTTMQTVLGDALAVALLERRGFQAHDFHRLHPKGRLGSRLRTVAHLMSVDDSIPHLCATATILDAAVEMTRKRFGATAIVDEDGRLIGSFTDGDLRRSLMNGGPGDHLLRHMSASPQWIEPDMLAADALTLMNERQILQLFVCRDERLVGIVHLHDILAAA